MPTLEFFVVAGCCALLGAIVQSGIGLGLGLVAAPVVTLAFPNLMPGSLLIAAAVLPVLVLAKEVRHADWGGSAGRSPGGSPVRRSASGSSRRSPNVRWASPSA